MTVCQNQETELLFNSTHYYEETKMLTVKVIIAESIEIFQAPEVSIVDEYSPELRAHIADCNIKSANINASSQVFRTPDTSEPVRHDDMKAAIFAGNRSVYLYPGDKCYITNDAGKTIHSLNFTVGDDVTTSDVADR